MAGPNSLLNRENFPVLRELRRPGRPLRERAAPAPTCYHLFFKTEIEEYQVIAPETVTRFHSLTAGQMERRLREAKRLG
jgi:hypothetical protein